MNVDQAYQKMIQDLAQGSRALTRFSVDELEELKNLLSAQSPELEKILCLIEHSANFYGQFEPKLLEVLKAEVPDRQKIFALNCARKHIIQLRFREGRRLDFDFLETLKKLLFSSSPELVEWTLRTIEECGTQGVYFLKEFDKIKPAPWKWFNPHQRAVREIITMLERRWDKFEKH